MAFKLPCADHVAEGELSTSDVAIGVLLDPVGELGLQKGGNDCITLLSATPVVFPAGLAKAVEEPIGGILSDGAGAKVSDPAAEVVADDAGNIGLDFLRKTSA